MWNDFSLMQPQTKKKEKPFWLNQVSSLKLVRNLKHLSCKQFHKIVKSDFTFLGTLRNLQNIYGLNRLSK